MSRMPVRISFWQRGEPFCVCVCFLLWHVCFPFFFYFLSLIQTFCKQQPTPIEERGHDSVCVGREEEVYLDWSLLHRRMWLLVAETFAARNFLKCHEKKKKSWHATICSPVESVGGDLGVQVLLFFIQVFIVVAKFGISFFFFARSAQGPVTSVFLNV